MTGVGAVERRPALESVATAIRARVEGPVRVIVCMSDGRAEVDTMTLAERDEAAAALAAHVGVAQLLADRLRVGHVMHVGLHTVEATVVVVRLADLLVTVVAGSRAREDEVVKAIRQGVAAVAA